MTAGNLNHEQATGALGLVLSQLRKYLPADQFEKIHGMIPGCDTLIAKAPAIKSGLFGGMVNTLGNEKTKMLMDLNKGLSALGIPTSKQKDLAQVLKSSVEKHYPNLAAMIDIA